MNCLCLSIPHIADIVVAQNGHDVDTGEPVIKCIHTHNLEAAKGKVLILADFVIFSTAFT